MSKNEALKLALEALENSVDLVREDAYNAEQLYGKYPSRQARVQGLKVLADDHEKAITAIKEALEEPVQEPVAILNHAHGVYAFRSVNLQGLPDGEYQIYTTPPAAQRPWVGLTGMEIMELWKQVYEPGHQAHVMLNAISKAIEAELKELNA